MKTDWAPFKSSLEDISDALERAGDEWRMSLNVLAEKENEYRRVHAIAWVQASQENVAVTIRSKHCENQVGVVAARCEWALAGASEKSCHSKVEELKNRLMARMSDQKYLGQSDGGFG